ncbi:MAG TPA: 50S ribosomal protein L17 [Bacteroidales bacterium]|nr:50S ribosomal protein L17 [Bacteroidales bacterium]HPJ59422.1 50S ribosomal protein L17 [Bacteroidales bacterium]HRW86257.1 50S ribosomal protein L17 [Bacteroidales bacterium]
MRHSKVINHLGRKSSHRKSMLANMASSLILHKRITTTTAKAKALRTYVEPLITKSKEDSTHSRREVFSILKDKKAVAELFREISPKIADRPGGYTRILKTGNRIGDNAEMCIMELVDYNENMLGTAETTKTKGRRRRSSSKKKSEADDSQKKSAPEAKKTAKEPVAEEQPEAENNTGNETATGETEETQEDSK